MSLFRHVLVVSLFFCAACSNVSAERTVVTERMQHLRVGAGREWTDFAAVPEATTLDLTFDADSNAQPATLRLRQQDVKQTWKVRWNGTELGELQIDENDMVVYFDVPARTLVDGANQLLVQQQGDNSDDVRVGEIWIDDRPVSRLLEEATVGVSVVDSDSR
ncbi:MAG: hypothetical protein O3C40_06330 [Planctomycetota bacterium]|nr:hypothetical protein [Planctomycetota bacterium]